MITAVLVVFLGKCESAWRVLTTNKTPYLQPWKIWWCWGMTSKRSIFPKPNKLFKTTSTSTMSQWQKVLRFWVQTSAFLDMTSKCGHHVQQTFPACPCIQPLYFTKQYLGLLEFTPGASSYFSLSGCLDTKLKDQGRVGKTTTVSK